MRNLEDEMKVDMKAMANEDVNMLTCTPVLAGRKLNFAPESPFLTANNNLRNATPVIHGIQVRANGDSDVIKLGYGITMNKPSMVPPKPQQQNQKI